MSDTASRQSGSSNASTKEPKRLVKGAVEVSVLYQLNYVGCQLHCISSERWNFYTCR